MSSVPAEQQDDYRPALATLWWGKFSGPLATLAASLGAFAFFALQGILLARLLGPELRGAFAAAVLFPQTLLYIGLLGAPELFAGHAARGMPSAPLRRSAAVYGLFAGCLSLVVCLILNAFFLKAEFRWVLPLAGLCALTLPLQQIRLAVQAVDHGQRELSRYNQGRILAAAAFPLVLLLGFVFQTRDLTTICIMFLVSQAIALPLIQRGMLESWSGPRSVSVPQALNQARPLIAAWLASEILERLDMCLMLAIINDDATLGYYAAAVPIASLLIIVPNAASLYAFNRGARKDEIPTAKAVCGYLMVGFGIQVVSAAILGALLPTLIHVFYGPRFAPTVMFAWLLLPAGMFRGLLQALDGYLRARGRAITGVVTRLLGTVLLVGIAFGSRNWLVSHDWSAAYSVPIGLSVALGFCFVVMSAIVLSDVLRHHDVRKGTAVTEG